jgi:hypothetical protein
MSARKSGGVAAATRSRAAAAPQTQSVRFSKTPHQGYCAEWALIWEMTAQRLKVFARLPTCGGDFFRMRQVGLAAHHQRRSSKGDLGLDEPNHAFTTQSRLMFSSGMSFAPHSTTILQFMISIV